MSLRNENINPFSLVNFLLHPCSSRLHAVSMAAGTAADNAVTAAVAKLLRLRISKQWQRCLLMRDGVHTDVHYQHRHQFSLRNSGNARA